MTEQNKGGIGDEQSPEELAKLKAEEESKLKLQESEKEKLGKAGEEKPKVDDTDYKALFEKEKKEREAAEVAQKQMLSGLTPKLQQLADYEKVNAEREAKVAESDELVEIDKHMAEIDKEIPLYENNIDQDTGRKAPLDTTALRANRLALKNQRKQILRDRATSATTKEWLDFGDAHLDFDDYAGLNKIVAEAAKRKDPISPETAFRIWERDQKIAKAEESAAIDKDSKDLSGKALGEDGKPIPDAVQAKSGATWEFYKDKFGEEKAAEMLGIK